MTYNLRFGELSIFEKKLQILLQFVNRILMALQEFGLHD